MITVGDKKRNCYFGVSTQGIESKDLEFWLRFQIEGISYGFKGESEGEGKIKVSIPPASEFLKEVDSSKSYPAKVEIIGENKYYMVTWDGQIKFETAPKVVTNLKETSEETFISKKPNSVVTEILEQYDDESENEYTQSAEVEDQNGYDEQSDDSLYDMGDTGKILEGVDEQIANFELDPIEKIIRETKGHKSPTQKSTPVKTNVKVNEGDISSASKPRSLLDEVLSRRPDLKPNIDKVRK